MKLTGLAVLSEAAVIVNSVGRVGILLNLGKKYTLANCVHCARFDEKNIALLDLNPVADIHHCVALSGFFELLNGNIAVKAENKLCVRLTVENVPRLGLSEFALNPHCIFVVGMNLNRKISFGVDKLYKQRKKFIFFALRAANALICKVNLLQGLALVFAVENR